MEISYKKHMYISLGICISLIFSLAVASLIANYIFPGLGILSKEVFISEEETLEFGIIDKQMPNVRLEIPVGYFYRLHGGREGWDALKRRRSFGRKVFIDATMDGLKPYSQETMNLFKFSHKKKNIGKIIHIGIVDRKTVSIRSNSEHLSTFFLEKSVHVKSEYEGLEKYMENEIVGRFSYFNGTNKESYEHYRCNTSVSNFCNVFDCKGEYFCIDYQIPINRMSEWKNINKNIWELLEKFRVQ